MVLTFGFLPCSHLHGRPENFLERSWSVKKCSSLWSIKFLEQGENMDVSIYRKVNYKIYMYMLVDLHLWMKGMIDFINIRLSHKAWLSFQSSSEFSSSRRRPWKCNRSHSFWRACWSQTWWNQTIRVSHTNLVFSYLF